jgi:hypothetical protein
MATTTISYGTEVWLAELLQTGWKARVVEHRPVLHHYHLTLEDDLEEAVHEVTSPDSVGVAVTGPQGAGVFVPCSDEREALALLERVEGQAWPD